jgi:hypothetical protein
MKTKVLSVIMTYVMLFSVNLCFSQGGAIKIFPRGDIILGGLSVGGYGLNIQPSAYTYLNPQIFTAWSWANSVNAGHDQQICNMVSRAGICNSWDLGDGTRWARKTYLVGSDYHELVDVLDLSNSLEIVLKLRGTSYRFSNDTSAFKPDTMIVIDKDGSKQSIISNGEERWNDTSHYSRQILNKIKDELSWKHFGVIAQEVQEILPEAVRTMPDGSSAVDYNSLIPYLIEAIKELNLKVERSNSEPPLHFNTKESEFDVPLAGNAKLYQNKPNPFSKETTINYEISENAKKAEIHVFNLEGTLLKTYLLNTSGELKIRGFEFKPGMYLYSLIQDGIEIDTKRFILTNSN